MKLLWFATIATLSLFSSDPSNEKYLKYQEPPSDMIPTPLEEDIRPGGEVTMTVFDKRGLTVALDGKVVLFIKDHVTEIRIKKEEEKKNDCTIL